MNPNVTPESLAFETSCPGGMGIWHGAGLPNFGIPKSLFVAESPAQHESSSNIPTRLAARY